jgi:NADH-quinone oxidoreductase subunit E
MSSAFVFNDQNLAKAREVINNYPKGKQASAVIFLLDLAQRQSGGWLPKEAMNYVAEFLEMAAIRVYEVASFYSMFNLSPVGKYLIQVCGTTPCWLRGAADIVQASKEELGIDLKETTPDNLFTLVEVECLGACANAPMVQINDDYYEDLTPEIMKDMLDKLKKGESLKCGSQIGRKCSAKLEG